MLVFLLIFTKEVRSWDARKMLNRYAKRARIKATDISKNRQTQVAMGEAHRSQVMANGAKEGSSGVLGPGDAVFAGL